MVCFTFKIFFFKKKIILVEFNLTLEKNFEIKYFLKFIIHLLL